MQKIILFTLIFLSLCCLNLSAVSSDTVSVVDLGLRPDIRENAVPYVQKALEMCKGKGHPILVFPKGRYDFWPHHCIEQTYFESNTIDINPKRLAILIKQMEGLTIEGNGSTFVFHDRMQPLTIDSCRNITIRNFSVDWDIPLTAQSEITAVTNQYIDIKINACESPYIIENNKLVFVGEGWKSEWWGVMEFQKETRNIVPQTGDVCLGENWRNYHAEELSKGMVRLHCNFTHKPTVGNLLVLRHSQRDHAGVFITDSRNIQIENVDIYHTAGLGILSQYSENMTFVNVNCIPNELKGRILAGHDDGFHYANCKGNVIVKECTFHGLMDDPINVHGTSVRIIERLNDFTLRCKFMHSGSIGLRWANSGDTVGFIDSNNMQTIAKGVVSTFKKIDDQSFDISFKKNIPNKIVAGYALENLSWTCNVSITDSYFKSCRARGILVSTSGKVVVENNTFETSGSAILIAGDANYWYESGAVKDVLIRNNIFKAPCLTSMYQFCEGVISIYPEIPYIARKMPPFHRNIIITGNEFHLFDYPIVYALSVENIVFSYNKLIRSYQFEPFHTRKNGLTFEECRKITVKDNITEGDVLGNTIKLINTPQKECKLDKNSFFKFAE